MSHELSPQERSAARAALIKSGVATRGMSDEQLQAQAATLGGAMPHGMNGLTEGEPTTPATTQEPQTMQHMTTATPAPAATDLGAQIAALIQANMTPQAPAVDEAAIIKLIKKHTAPVVTLKIDTTKTTGTTIKTIDGAHNALKPLLSLAKLYPIVNRAPYLVGPAGSGKTTLAIQAAEALDVPFYSTGAVFDKFELLGFQNANGDYVESALFKAYTGGGIFLFDEVDASAPEALVAFNQLIANGVYTFPNGELVTKHPHFYPVAAANTVGTGANRQYCGRTALDGATLDRFNQLTINYDHALEDRLALQAALTVEPKHNHSTVELWVATVRKARQWADSNQVPALITPRDSVSGAAMLADGWKQADVLQATIFSKLTADQTTQLKRAL